MTVAIATLRIWLAEKRVVVTTRGERLAEAFHEFALSPLYRPGLCPQSLQDGDDLGKDLAVGWDGVLLPRVRVEVKKQWRVSPLESAFT